MSLLRKWSDPFLSRRYLHQKSSAKSIQSFPHLQLSVRLDDIYSYLLVQLLPQFVNTLNTNNLPLTITIHTKSVISFPGNLDHRQWQQYSLQDGSRLASQYGLTLDSQSAPPINPSIQQALQIIQNNNPDQAILLLPNLMHILWQQQQRKLDLLYDKHQQIQPSQSNTITNIKTKVDHETPLLSAMFTLGDKTYHGIDDFLRLLRHLNRIDATKASPVFLTDHIEWGEHHIHAPEQLSLIQTTACQLKFFGCLEDPFTWIILKYLKEHVLDYYNIKLDFFPLPYQSRDQFDRALTTRLSRRADVPFIPFNRPAAPDSFYLAKFLLSLPQERLLESLLMILESIWSEGKTVNQSIAKCQKQLNLPLIDVTNSAVKRWLIDNQQQLHHLEQPYLPAFELLVNKTSYVFCGIYRLWLIESLLTQITENNNN